MAASMTETPRSVALIKTTSKIKKLSDIAHAADRYRKDGKRIALAHGVFDLLHMGHVRHLEEARSHGDLLIVSITPDRFVNKGPGRPVFGEEIRAEMLAALACVDWVIINEAPTAEALISDIKPDAYVKGPDYAHAADDVTGKIAAEQTQVEMHGGQIIFTEDITFSSSTLINRYFNPFDTKARIFIDEMREEKQEKPLLDLLDRAADLRVLVVGEAIMDEYRYVQPMNKTPKENLVATLYQSAEVFAGGAVATANHAAALCKNVELLTIIGDDAHGVSLQKRVKPNVRLNAITRPNAPTVSKVRYIDSGEMRKMFEVYYMEDRPLAEEQRAKIDDFIREHGSNYDLIIVNDFGHGMITESTVETLVQSARFLAVNTQTNSGNFGFNLISKFPRADYVCIDTPEARLATQNKTGSIENLLKNQLSSMLPGCKIIVTQGKDGCLAFTGDEPLRQIPAVADKIIDTVGAGDAFLAITAPLVAAGGDMRQVGFIGNIAGALKVGIVGHRHSLDKVSMIKAVVAMLK